LVEAVRCFPDEVNEQYEAGSKTNLKDFHGLKIWRDLLDDASTNLGKEKLYCGEFLLKSSYRENHPPCLSPPPAPTGGWFSLIYLLAFSGYIYSQKKNCTQTIVGLEFVPGP
jgi:hypothetical protein